MTKTQSPMVFRSAAIVVWLVLCTITFAQAAFDAKQFGAKGDSKNDDTTAIQSALDAAGKVGGGVVQLPAGQYRINGSLSVPSGVALEGVWRAPHHSDQSWGSALFAHGGRGSDTGAALVELQPSACIKGVTIYYPAQTTDAITPYPYSIRLRGMNGTVEDVTLANSYQGIDVGTHPNELHMIRDVYGCVLRTGIFVDKCTDVGRIENVHFNPHYWGRVKLPAGQPAVDWQKMLGYINANCEPFVFGRTDWEYVTNTFAFGFKNCYKFIQTKDGACNGQFSGIGADGGVCCLRVEDVQPMGLLITNGQFVAFEGANPVQLETAASFDGAVQLSNCAFWGDSVALARLEGSGHVSLNQCVFLNCGKGDRSSAAIIARGGSLVVNNCQFKTSRNRFFDLTGVRSATITNNVFAGRAGIKDSPTSGIIVGQNVEQTR
ncbi:MAG: glycoside hydrolase family 55 protein [Candidatus Sumerlaeaceae bacterium]|nr:glycoside hydrolase family 55 protein [Candidatus Sumerlaeaceae bacterium]